MKSMNLRKRARGLSIVELMVAMVISLIGTIVIFQVYAVNEEVRRSATAGGDEQTNGLVGLMMVERELRTAGYGVNDSDLTGCNMVTYDKERTPNFPPAYPLAPVYIKVNVDAIPDVVRVIYAGATFTTVPVKLAAAMATVTTFPVVRYAYGYRAGNMVVIGEKNLDCTIREITQVSGTEIQTASGAYVDWTGVSRTTRWNSAAGTPAIYSVQGKVINLGDLLDDTRPPRYNEITVQTGMADPALNNKLVIQNLWGQTAGFIPVAEQIVQLKAEYGMDDGKDNNTVPAHALIKDDGIVDRYTTENPATADEWRLVKTVRLVLVSRSAQRIKPTEGNTQCDATPDYDPDPKNTTYPVRWAFGPDTPKGRPLDVRGSPVDANWRCYKYQVYETTVPLRNVLWSAT
jgi:type IV pilus assembly protein PilW